MKVLVLAGLFTAVAAPCAAADTVIECQVEQTRRAEQPRGEAPAPPARPTVAQREVAEQPPRPAPDRRRNGKRIPDAELIGPRGAL